MLMVGMNEVVMDKNVERLIMEYRSLPQSNRDNDLKKLNNIASERKPKRSVNKWVLYPALSCFILVAIIGVSLLGVYLYKLEGNSELTNGKYLENLSYVNIASIETYNERNNLNIKTAYKEEAIYSYKEYSNDKGKICVAITISEWSEELEKALIVAYLSDGRLNSKLYENLEERTSANGITIDYRVTINDSGKYCYYVEYVQEGIVYQAEFIFSNKADVDDVFEIIVA